MNHANRFPAIWNLRKRFAELLRGCEYFALAANAVLWPTLGKNDIKLFGKR
jgi:hypothetical protein